MTNKSTRGANGSGTIRKRANGIWEARYSVGSDPKTGKQIQRSIYGKTQKDVRQKLTKVLSELDDGTYIAPSKQTFGDWLDEWFDEYIRNTVKPYTRDSYRRILDNHLKPSLGNIKLIELKSMQIQKMYNTLLTEKQLSPKTIKNIHGVLHMALTQAMRLGLIHANPSEACVLPKTVRKEIRPMEESDIRTFLEKIRGEKYANVYWVTLFSGLRQGEVLGLTWDCVDFENQTITINKQLQKTEKVRGKYTLVSTKNGKSRLVTVAPAVMDALKQQQQAQVRMQITAGEAWDNQWNLVFTNEFGRHLVHITVYKNFKKIACDIGLPEGRFHDLRHSYAVAALENGDDIKTLQENLGHATSSFTMDVYGHVSKKMHHQSAVRMESFIKRLSDPA